MNGLFRVTVKKAIIAFQLTLSYLAYPTHILLTLSL